MASKEQQAKYSKKWRENPTNRERVRENARRWRTENPNKYREGLKRSYSRPEYKKLQRLQQIKNRRNNPLNWSYQHSKRRAKQKGLEFNLDVEYLESIWTGVCPVLGVQLFLGKEKGTINPLNLGSLDRLDNDRGYIKGNVHFISFRANNIKKDSSFDEFEQIYFWWKQNRETV